MPLIFNGVPFWSAGRQVITSFIIVRNSWLDRNPLDLVERNLILPPVVQLRRPGRFMVGDMLGHFQLAAVL